MCVCGGVSAPKDPPLHVVKGSAVVSLKHKLLSQGIRCMTETASSFNFLIMKITVIRSK